MERTRRQVRVFEALWAAVNERLVDPTLGGVDLVGQAGSLTCEWTPTESDYRGHRQGDLCGAATAAQIGGKPP
ncbi:MAG: hypothetical protein HY784_05980 [Chloroflexi bacterium]|nr:hypothetical protein [Chloroflexota bacterium]